MPDREKLIELLQSSPTDIMGNHPVGSLADWLISNGVAIQRSIPVTERLPYHGAMVLCITKHCFKYEAMQWDSTAECWYAKDGCHGKRYVSHWMPLPEPPEVRE